MFAVLGVLMLCGIIGAANYSDAKPVSRSETYAARDVSEPQYPSAPTPVSAENIPLSPVEPELSPVPQPSPTPETPTYWPAATVGPESRLKAVEEIRRRFYYPTQSAELDE